MKSNETVQNALPLLKHLLKGHKSRKVVGIKGEKRVKKYGEFMYKIAHKQRAFYLRTGTVSHIKTSFPTESFVTQSSLTTYFHIMT